MIGQGLSGDTEIYFSKSQSLHVSISSSLNRDDKVGKEINEIVFVNCTSFKNTRVKKKDTRVILMFLVIIFEE